MLIRAWAISLLVLLRGCRAVHLAAARRGANASDLSPGELGQNGTGPMGKMPIGLRGGLAFIKMPKCGGSTFGGVVRRIGNRHGMAHTKDGDWRRRGKPNRPAIWAIHGQRDMVESFLHENMPNAYMMTVIRNPIDRVMSEYYHYDASRIKKGVTSDLGKFRRVRRCKGHEMVSWASVSSTRRAPETVVASYNFVGVLERFDESLLLLGRELGLSLVDLVYLRSKVSGRPGTGHADLGHPTAYHPPLSEESPRVKRAARHLEHGPDMMFFILANQMLDKKREAYGATFAADLDRFRAMLADAEASCRDYFFDSCLWNDNGCAQDCIDRLAQKQTWVNSPL